MLFEGEEALQIEGKFFKKNGERVFLKMVTYGPFPDPQPDPVPCFHRMVAAQFNAIRVYALPDKVVLDAASEAGLMVFVGLSWEWERVFLGATDQVVFEHAKRDVLRQLALVAEHPAVVGCFVANEIRPDIARWLGVQKVVQALEEMISLVRQSFPRLLVAYSSYPSSEFLEPSNAHFTAMNVYLEDEKEYRHYLRRLHHVAGDRPVLISEFGVDSQSLGVERQAELLGNALLIAQSEGMAGWTCFAWSDRWQNGGEVVQDWSFGLLDRSDEPKLAYTSVQREWLPALKEPMFSVIICVYNGVDRIADALDALKALLYTHYEVIVVDDGSVDGTCDVVRAYPWVRLVEMDHQGLSAARNAGAAAARGEILSFVDDDCVVDASYLFWLAHAYEDKKWDACGGPNIPPAPQCKQEAVVVSAPGAPTHVMLDDEEAEHLPGCHLSVRKNVFDSIGGFRVRYVTAGDDVDFCWRLREAGFKIGFHGASFVWHRRRVNLWAYFRQQWGYGKAEALLMRDHPSRFKSRGGAIWKGCVYTGAAMQPQSGSVIYHGCAGQGGYQLLFQHMMPMRPLDASFGFLAAVQLVCVRKIQPLLREFARRWYGRSLQLEQCRHQCENESHVERQYAYQKVWVLGVRDSNYRDQVLARLRDAGWEFAGEYAPFDLQKEGARCIAVAERIGEKKWCVRVRVDASKRECEGIALEMEQILRGDSCR